MLSPSQFEKYFLGGGLIGENPAFQALLELKYDSPQNVSAKGPLYVKLHGIAKKYLKKLEVVAKISKEEWPKHKEELEALISPYNTEENAAFYAFLQMKEAARLPQNS